MTEQELLVRIAVTQGWTLCSDQATLSRAFRGHYRLRDEASQLISMGREILISPDGLDIESTSEIGKNAPELRYTSDLNLMMAICDFGWYLAAEDGGYAAYDAHGAGGHWSKHPAEALALLYLTVHRRRDFLRRKRSSAREKLARASL